MSPIKRLNEYYFANFQIPRRLIISPRFQICSRILPSSDIRRVEVSCSSLSPPVVVTSEHGTTTSVKMICNDSDGKKRNLQHLRISGRLDILLPKTYFSSTCKNVSFRIIGHSVTISWNSDQQVYCKTRCRVTGRNLKSAFCSKSAADCNGAAYSFSALSQRYRQRYRCGLGHLCTCAKITTCSKYAIVELLGF